MLDRIRSAFPVFVVALLGAPLILPSAATALGGSGPGIGTTTSAFGAATYRIPIPAPKGTGGFGPALELSYSSSRGDGPFGAGWSLGLSEIRRTTRFGTPQYDASDRFELDGQILVEAQTASEYRTEAETFQRIEHDVATGDQWIVTSPDGAIRRYGTTQEARIRKGGDTDPSDDTGDIFRWLLSEVEDVNGNVILFDYDRSVDPGTGYVEAIRYTYRGTPGARLPEGGVERRIDFLYEARPDPSQSYAGAVASRLGQRATEIRSTAAGQPFRRLIFSYAAAAAYSTSRSRIESAQLFGSDCPGTADPATCSGLPPQTFTYSDPGDAIGPAQSSQWASTAATIPPNLGPGVQLADVNGDGLPDIVQAYAPVV